MEVRRGILLSVQQPRPGGVSRGFWNDHGCGLQKDLEPDELRADAERPVHRRHLQSASCGVVWLGRLFAGVRSSEELLAISSPESLCQWLQPASCIHYVVGYSLFRNSRSATATEIC